ncbi:carboxylic ester hydrolase-like [Ornithodoros turicata]|uniref:carboxylic ester hydrolase-like n=1 Tax=Ornithodoros turicata TaxID=34597 RepID=UPI0031390A1B
MAAAALVGALLWAVLPRVTPVTIQVSTSYGTVNGVEEQTVSVNAIPQQVYAFRGIRYARPPLGWLRFSPPKEPERWVTQPDAPREPCVQLRPSDGTVHGKEDCLYLDVYTPKNFKDLQGNLPVVVLIAGADFQTGSKEDVTAGYDYGINSILVVVNYRLGAIGFLSTEDTHGPGNLGLWDQQAALKFVKENIASFGGDPSKITLMGFGAGAMSVSFHLLNRVSSGMFQFAIMSGGSATSPDAIVEKAKQKAEELGSVTGCSYRDSKQLLECLRELNPAQLLRSAHRNKLKFLPIVDANVSQDAFLLDSPEGLYASSFTPKPTIYGYTKDAGSTRFFQRMNSAADAKSVDDIVQTFLNEYFLDVDSRVGITAAVKYQYFRPRASRTNSTSNAINTIKMLTDFLVAAPVHLALRSHLVKATASKAYLYVFGYPDGGKTFARGEQRELYGATYMDDMLYTVNSRIGGVADTTTQYADQVLLSTMSTFFASFIRTGIPGGSLSRPMSLNAPQYANITKTNPNGETSHELYRSQEMAFWNVFVPDLHVQLNHTSWSSYMRAREAEHFRSATWGTVTVIVLLVLILVGLVAAFFVYRRQRLRSKRDAVEFKPLPSSTGTQPQL